MTATTTTFTTTDVRERLGKTISDLLDGIEAVQDGTTPRHGLEPPKRATDALYVLDREAAGEPVQADERLCFGNAPRG